MENGRKGRDMKRVGPLPQVAAEFPKGYLSCGRVLPEKSGVYTPSRAPQPRAPEPERGTHLTTGCEKHPGFYQPERDS